MFRTVVTSGGGRTGKQRNKENCRGRYKNKQYSDS